MMISGDECMYNFCEIIEDDIQISNIVCLKQTWRTNEQHSYLNMPRPNWGLIFFSCKEATFADVDGNTLNAYNGNIVYLPKGAMYKVTFNNPDETPVSTMLINFNLTSEENKDYTSSEIQVFIKNGQQFKNVFSDTIEMYEKYAPKSLKLKIRVLNLFNDLWEYNKKKGELLEQSIFYIEEHLNQTISIFELAKMCLVSETKYRMDFKARTGMSPKNYILNLKMSKAKQMLASGEISVSEVCDRLNFYDTAYFIKTFKKYTGMTPLQYKKQRLQSV